MEKLSQKDRERIDVLAMMMEAITKARTDIEPGSFADKRLSHAMVCGHALWGKLDPHRVYYEKKVVNLRENMGVPK